MLSFKGYHLMMDGNNKQHNNDDGVIDDVVRQLSLGNNSGNINNTTTN
jgi:hypothetical protein